MIVKFAKGSLVVLALGLSGCGKSNPSSEKEKATPTPTPLKQTAQKSTAVKPKVQQPREENPSTQSLRTRRENLLAEIMAITGSSGGELTTEQWQKVKKHYWRSGFNQPIANKSTQPSVEGLIESNSPKESLIEQLATGKFTSINNQDEQQALIALHLLAMMSASAGGRTLPAAFADRANQSVPTQGDLYLFDVFNDAFVEVDNRRQLVPSELKTWGDLAGSPNPVYRLLALQNFWHVTPDSSQWIDFYKLYVKENDPAIIDKLIGLTTQTSKPNASAILLDLKTNPNVSTNPQLTERIDHSIEFLKSLPPADSKQP